MAKTAAEIAKIKASGRHIYVSALQFADAGSTTGIPDTIHLIPIGQWEHDAYGPILITSGDIREFEQNFNAKIRKGVPITAGHEGFEELPAVGWIMSVEARGDGLWGKVDWNKEGKRLLSDKAFKFFSPEFFRDYEDPQTHQMYRNVITGGALTKSPYFKELEAVVFSEKILKNKFNDTTMKLEDIVAKDVAALTDEEKAFLKEHEAELSDDQKTAFTSVLEGDTDDKTETEDEKTAREAKEAEDAKAVADKAVEDANVAAGLNPDGTTKVEGSEKGKVITMSETEANLLRKKADEGAQAYAELQKMKTAEKVKTMVFNEKTNASGKFLPKSEAALTVFMSSLNASQLNQFTSLVAEIPQTKEMFKELGEGKGVIDGGDAYAEVEAKAAKKMSEKKIGYSDALKEVFAEEDGLEERYSESLPSAKK